MFILENVQYKNILTVNSLKIEKGKITVIIGHSGGGKSTLLKLLNKTLSPTSGNIIFKDNKLDAIDPVTHRRKVVYLSQSPYLFKGTVKENLLKGLRFHEKPLPDDDVLSDILKMVSLHKSLDDSVVHLSGGETQRLALGRVLLLDAEVYLLDEPSSALDDETEKILIETITKYVKDNDKTLVMISHSQSIAKKYGDYIYEIKDGKIKRSDNA